MTSTIPLASTGGQFMVTTVTGSYSVTKNNAGAFSTTGTNAGWYPLGIVYFAAGWNQMCFYGMYPSSMSSGSITIDFKGRNLSTTTDSGTRTATFHVLWVRE